VAEAENGDEAYEYIVKLNPDLVFLDISMPRESGFDLLRRLPHLNFELIFITSFDQYALEAIEFCAIGYIVKPISTEYLIHAVENAKKRIQQKQGFNHNQVLIENFSHIPENKKIALPTSTGIEFISVKEIVRCEGYQKYTKIHISDGRTIVSSHNIGKFATMLEEYGFYPIHKSHIINTNYISSYLNEGVVVLTDGSKAPVSRRKKNEFLAYLKNAT
jgi:two-component system LytT family response regulator